MTDKRRKIDIFIPQLIFSRQAAMCAHGRPKENVVPNFF